MLRRSSFLTALLSLVCWLLVISPADAQLVISPGVRLTSAQTWSALQTFSAGILLGSDDTLAWGDAVGGGTADTFLSRVSAAKLNFGAADSSSPVAQILTFQGYNNAVATAGPLAIIRGSNGGLTSGTGGELRLQGGLSGAAAGTGGAITFYTAPLAAGTTPALAMTIDSTKLVTFASNVTMGRTMTMNGSSSGSLTIDAGATAASVTYSTGAIFGGSITTGNNIAWSSGNDTNLSRLSASLIGVGTGSAGGFGGGLKLDNLTLAGANGQLYALGRKTELITVASGVLTQASTITIPADAILKAAEIRFTVQPGGTATAVVTATTSATVLQQGANMSTAAGTTDVGTRAWGTNYVGVAAQTVTFTFNGVTSDALGRIRLDLVFEQPTAPTS